VQFSSHSYFSFSLRKCPDFFQIMKNQSYSGCSITALKVDLCAVRSRTKRTTREFCLCPTQ
jgi:hypothetical protein